MQIARRPLRRACLYFGLLFSLVLSGLGAEKSRVKAEDYVIDAEIVPRTHHLTARAKVKCTALDDTKFGTFELNNGLRVTRVADGNGRALTAERISQDNAVRVAFPNGMAKGSASTLTFEYEGTLSTADDSPVEGLKLAHIDEEFTYLLYPGRWFPVTNYGIDRFIGEKVNYRLLADIIAHQWWGVSISPVAKDDWWLVDGGARASEMRYVQNTAGEQAFEESTKDMSVGALAYDTVPLSSIAKLDTFSPEFQALVTDKGGMIFHMLRWVVGDAAFDKSIKEFMATFGGKPSSVGDFQAITEKNYGEKLTAFFSQWVDGTGAPEFKMKYTVFRVKKGFRIVGQITQDLDLFRMPLELKVDTDGQSEMKRIEVVGTSSSFTVETFGKPRRLVLDPNNWVLKNSGDLRTRVAIRRGQELTQSGNLAEALAEFNKALDVNKNSSLAHYRIAEVFYLQRNYQSAANEYRESISGDQEPRWTEVWSHVMLGKIFDTTGQRERAVNEYRQAIQTNDNTQGALDEARRYLSTPYTRDRRQNGQY